MSDIDKGSCKLLAHRFPGVPNLGDITKIDWLTVSPVDVITAGFPCQPVSHAGKRLGDVDERWLWDEVVRAVRAIRPGLVVLENVRGLLTARSGRLFGRVLGSLADLGYDAEWYGLRAADIGAPHGRFRVFVVAYPEGDARWVGNGDGGAAAYPSGLRRGTWGTPAPGEASGGRTSADFAGRSLLPTPSATDGTKGGPNQRGSSGDLMLPSAVALLPTPAVNDMGEGKTPEAWDEWTARMKDAHGNGNGHGPSLAIEAQRLLPTPMASHQFDRSASENWEGNSDLPSVVKTIGEVDDASTTEARPGEVLPGVRGADHPQEIQREARGPGSLPASPDLLAELREHPLGGADRHPQVASPADPGADRLRGVRNDRAATRTSPRPEPREQRPYEPDDALRELPPLPSLAGGSPCAHGCGPACSGHSAVAWGDYEAAIRRWEVCLSRPAPDPTRLSAKGSPQLDARFVEFLMGLPAGWVTGVPGLTRNDMLKLCGNGVVPQQAEAALRLLLAREAVAT